MMLTKKHKLYLDLIVLFMAMIIAFIGYGGIVYYYGWKLALFVFLVFWSHKIETRTR